MSGSWTVRNLEEIFLSHEFAGSGAARGRLELTDGRWVLAPTSGPTRQLTRLTSSISSLIPRGQHSRTQTKADSI